MTSKFNNSIKKDHKSSLNNTLKKPSQSQSDAGKFYNSINNKRDLNSTGRSNLNSRMSINDNTLEQVQVQDHN